MKLFKLILLTITAVFFIASANAQQTDIKRAKDMTDNSQVILSGTIIKVLGKKDFILKDDSGEIEIELDFNSREEKVTFLRKYQNLLGASVVIEGFLEKETLSKTKVEVKKINVIKEPAVDLFLKAVDGDGSLVTSIASAKDSKDKDLVILKGNITKMIHDDAFVLTDSTDGIKIDIDFISSEDKAMFLKKYPNLIGSQVIVQGNIDKEFLGKPEIDVIRIVVLTKGEDSFAKAVEQAKSAN